MANNYNPDVLNCIANLSNDEVFTPPALANQVLDMLPQELFKNPGTTFLDPFTKSCVFLREIVKRLDRGLESTIPDRQERIDHIMHRQVFGIACTELTAHLSRRSLYCSKHPDGKYSVSRFGNPEGNIQYKALRHTWEGGKCRFCGASKEVYDRGDAAEQYAYQFIHTENPESIFNMKFDVIIGNPPYQLSCASEKNKTNGAFASAIYPLFIEQACKLNPRYVVMITPSRWMTRTGQGVSDEWVDKMIGGNHFREIHDFLDSNLCFAGVDIMGGVNYFLYDPEYIGPCNYSLHLKEKIVKKNGYLDPFNCGIVVRDAIAKSIIENVREVEGDYYINDSFASMVGPSHFFDKNGILNSGWKGYSKYKDEVHTVKYYLNKRLEECGFAWIRKSEIPKGIDTLKLHKVYIPKANGSFGEQSPVLGSPFYGEPNSVCSQTYIPICYDAVEHNYSKVQCENVISYIKTRFFRFMVSIKKMTQDAPRDVYQFVPMQDFDKAWTDKELYEKYKLSEEQIAYIEKMIRVMD